MPQWVEAATLETLPVGHRRVFKSGDKQIALFHTDRGMFACNNRCPHEGYPLIEGSLEATQAANGHHRSTGCKLTCNWHAWTFDLASGDNAAGGDRLRTYPVKRDDQRILVDVSDPPDDARQAEALASLKDCFRQNDRDRMARELARLQAANGDPLDGLRKAIHWTYDRFAFGMTHAYAAAPDWLALRQTLARDRAEALVPLVEAVAHINYDSLREPAYPFTQRQDPGAHQDLVQAIEEKNEDRATALLRHALAGDAPAQSAKKLLAGPLATAALAHYADFGHAAIYLLKTGQLIDALGDEVAEPLLLCLTRALIQAWREDLIPEFKAYHPALRRWRDPAGGGGDAPVTAADFQRLSVAQALARCLRSKDRPEELYAALLGAAGWNMLHFDLALDQRTDNPVSQNKTWLSFTHAITFANAARHLAERQPALWPQALLQMACFVGRNSPFLDPDISLSAWRVDDPSGFLSDNKRGLFDHQQAEPIVACHLLKLLFAVGEEVARAPGQESSTLLLAACRRFLASPLKRPHTLRAARQALTFVAGEG